MAEQLKLMCVLAHPDDETLGTGGVIAKYSAEGVETCVITATRGERGWFGDEADNPGLEALGRLREAELHAATEILGVSDMHLLDYIDGDLDQADPGEAVSKIVAHIRRVKPHVVITFDPFGAYGHPDHIAICQFTTAAIVCAADPAYGNSAPHRVSKLYYMADRKELIQEFESVVGEISMMIDGVQRRASPWEGWAITTQVDARAHWKKVKQAALCHRTQLPSFEQVWTLPENRLQELFGIQTFYRALSLVNGGRKVEHDLLEGLRS